MSQFEPEQTHSDELVNFTSLDYSGYMPAGNLIRAGELLKRPGRRDYCLVQHNSKPEDFLWLYPTLELASINLGEGPFSLLFDSPGSALAYLQISGVAGEWDVVKLSTTEEKYTHGL